MVSVTYFYREPRKTGLSIEGIFKLVKECLEGKADIKVFVCEPGLSRLQNTKNAAKFTNKINHITGDVNYLAIGFKKGKTVLTIHDFGHYENMRKGNKLKFAIYKLFWFTLPIRKIDIITVVSEFTKGKLMEYLGFPEQRIRVIYDPIKPLFQVNKKTRAGNIPKVLQVGTGPHKNLANLIEASLGLNIHVDIVGYPTDAELNKLKDYNISHKVYNNLTDQQLYERYIECDILYFASFHEGFGMPIIEAQSVGRPVITSNFGAMKEVAKESALLVDPANTTQIREAIQTLAVDANVYIDMVNKGLENSIPYRANTIANQYLDVYNELLA